jgi:phage gp16-like protein
MTATRPADPRRRELARIHILAQRLGLSREQYEAVLLTVASVDSAALLDSYGRRQVIDHLERRLPPDRRGGWRGRSRQRAASGKAGLVAKIQALLIHARPARDDAYADAMALRMFGVQRFTWCNLGQLGKIVAALAIDARRQGKVQP